MSSGPRDGVHRKLPCGGGTKGTPSSTAYCYLFLLCRQWKDGTRVHLIWRELPNLTTKRTRQFSPPSFVEFRPCFTHIILPQRLLASWLSSGRLSLHGKHATASKGPGLTWSVSRSHLQGDGKMKT